jgi:hypothetical protein
MNKEQRIKDLAEVRKSNNPDAVLVAKINDLREQAFNLIKKLEDKTVEKTYSVLAENYDEALELVENCPDGECDDIYHHDDENVYTWDEDSLSWQLVTID